MPHRLPLLLFVGIPFFVKFGVTLWAAPRGFDIGDGGFFLLNLNDPAVAPPLFEFYKLLDAFDPPLRFEVVPTRLLRIATELFGLLLLSGGVFRWARTRFPSVAAAGFPLFALLAGMGALLSVGSRSFGYNDLTIFLLSASTGGFFAIAAGATPSTGSIEGATRRRILLGAALVGFLVGFQLFVKFPAALLMAAALGAATLFLLRCPLRLRVELASAQLAGFVGALLFFIATNGGVEPLLAKWAYATEISRVTNYGVLRILRVYVDHDWTTHVNNLRLALAFGVSFGLAWIALRRRPDGLDRSLTAALTVGAAVLLWGVTSFHPPTVHPSLPYLFGVSLLLAIVTGGILWRGHRNEGGAPEVGLLWILLALPFIGIIGTNVALTLKLPNHAAPLFVLLAILGLEAYDRLHLRRFVGLALVLLMGVTSTVFLQHHVRTPYGLARGIPNQTEPVAGLPGVSVDPATRKFLETLATEMEAAGFEPGDPILALDFMPGLVHYLGGRSPSFPFYHFENPVLNCFEINRIDPGVRPFLILGRGMSRDQHACITAFDYPDDFRPVATIRNPYEAAYPKFFGGPLMPYIHVFAPRDLAGAGD